SAATIQLPHFTLIAATTRAGLIAPPLRDRFGIMFHLDFYLKEELFQILIRTARILGVKAEEAALMEIAARSRGTPRICNRLLKRVRDFATVRQVESISEQIAKESLTALSVDAQGLDDLDRKYLNFLMEKFGGGPVGLETMASALGEDSETLEEICEPYLLQQGFIQRTPRGRMAAKALAGDL
ncbi:MAG: Holliday junction branch migration DNA helicase RuvB, partial [Candidatus Eremiobacteraeota bacterium]|nr:Holliday junction branch migration DNA helicase RuvB [Candidatus Eremiobacteraeota bacterium]